ncbi:bifunctional 3,4-dihydroxy-2-butanone-4-phosphate synthase/GTP cyclohydrolase II [Paenalcaligenes hominis]|uniref:3,4-dihydroxy-2-butanone 4-phosphate synthase n=1 Tax=Paenalcaligenes hominis TaxID=643674 RepID=A0ABX0WSM4_9BURK|nr:bifunctional 3,4-dihydroxy-2-butanone-4-phosphate synthase/GTP cyclohydrolase II [Paenalcaligenes hominis]NJB65732.1 3,4-dihydroxy 2-butanone 4-phosphate synthase/GTP cyclohydrolase II [Paenalcaligenes hominis]GGE63427.1 3,4-dihydroxy-2-butanone-4-phosphate synthase [Paenalcaligenes hominis]
MNQQTNTTHSGVYDISPITDIVAELRAGRMVILVDEEDRENEGDLVMAAEFVTPEAINFMVTHGRGLVCLTLTEERCQQLDLPLMAVRNGTRFGTNFTVSIEAAEGVETGISAADRAKTVRAAVARDARPSDLVQPGHIFPLKAENGGVLVRAGHTEAGCDLTRMAGLTPAAVICEILNADGTMARLPQLIEFAQQHNLKIGTIADLIQYRSAHESMVERLFEQDMTTPWGRFRAIGYKDLASGAPHLALVHGDIDPNTETLVRVHEPTTVLDLLCADSDDHSWSIPDALATISKAESGVVVMLNCQGAEDKIFEQFTLRSPEQTEALARAAEHRYDLRTYGIGAQILRDLDVGQARLLARPRKMPSMTGFALTITGYLTEPTA